MYPIQTGLQALCQVVVEYVCSRLRRRKQHYRQVVANVEQGNPGLVAEPRTVRFRLGTWCRRGQLQAWVPLPSGEMILCQFKFYLACHYYRLQDDLAFSELLEDYLQRPQFVRCTKQRGKLCMPKRYE